MSSQTTPASPESPVDDTTQPSVQFTAETALKTRRNSLTGLPQYDKSIYSQGKRRAAAGGAHIAEGDDLDPGGVQWEPNKAETEWFHEAMHTATAAISDDKPSAYRV